MSQQAETQAQRLCVGLQNGRKKDHHGVIKEWHMRAGELLEKRQSSAEAEFMTERDIEFDFTHAPYKHVL